jgi:hypothetical protein
VERLIDALKLARASGILIERLAGEAFDPQRAPLPKTVNVLKFQNRILARVEKPTAVRRTLSKPDPRMRIRRSSTDQYRRRSNRPLVSTRRPRSCDSLTRVPQRARDSEIRILAFFGNFGREIRFFDRRRFVTGMRLGGGRFGP